MLPDVNDLVVVSLALVVHTEDTIQFVLVHQFVQTPQNQLSKSTQLNSINKCNEYILNGYLFRCWTDNSCSSAADNEENQSQPHDR